MADMKVVLPAVGKVSQSADSMVEKTVERMAELMDALKGKLPAGITAATTVH